MTLALLGFRSGFLLTFDATAQTWIITFTLKVMLGFIFILTPLEEIKLKKNCEHVVRQDIHFYDR